MGEDLFLRIHRVSQKQVAVQQQPARRSQMGRDPTALSGHPRKKSPSLPIQEEEKAPPRTCGREEAHQQTHPKKEAGFCRLSPCDTMIGIHVALFHMLLTADTRSFKDSLSHKVELEDLNRSGIPGVYPSKIS